MDPRDFLFRIIRRWRRRAWPLRALLHSHDCSLPSRMSPQYATTHRFRIHIERIRVLALVNRCKSWHHVQRVMKWLHTDWKQPTSELTEQLNDSLNPSFPDAVDHAPDRAAKG